MVGAVVEVEVEEVADGDVVVVEGLVFGFPLRALPVMSSKGSWSVWTCK